MVVSLGTNVLSQKVQRQLGNANAELGKVSERLASGQRINRASDDAAGLSIASSLRTNTKIFAQGIRNLNDGLSAVGIAEGALGELTDITIRIEELASQSMNGTFSDKQRSSLQKEVTALQAEWNRIIESTSFNGAQLLTGSNTRIILQGGKGVEGTLAVELGARAFEGGVDNNAGSVSRALTGFAGDEIDANIGEFAISANGRYVVFETGATNVIAGDGNSSTDVFRKDLLTGRVELVSASSSGTIGDGGSSGATISGDGRYVTFQSGATNLVADDNNTSVDVFVKDMETGSIQRITGSTGEEANANVTSGSISSDGRYVAFRTFASNITSEPTNLMPQIYRKDLWTGDITKVSTSASGEEANFVTYETSISADGRYVAFYTTASNLIQGDTNNRGDVFVKDVQTGAIQLASVSESGVQGNASSFELDLSADGRHVVFQSGSTNFVANDTNGRTDIFLKDLDSGSLTRVSTNFNGAQSNHNSAYARVSADGRYVSFHSFASNLVGDDTNGTADIFVKDTKNGSITRVNVSNTGEQANDLSFSSAISSDGRTVIFDSDADNLDSFADSDANFDLFIRDLRKTGVQQLAGMVVSNAASARITLDLVRSYREELLGYRAAIGATTSRIDTFRKSLENARLTYEGAYSRIADADVAEESSKAIALSIRQQIAGSLAGQANQAPQIALDLLRNA